MKPAAIYIYNWVVRDGENEEWRGQKMLNGFGLWLADRLKEPSTWAANGVMAIIIHSSFPGAEGNAILLWASATCALLGFILPERKNGGTHIHVTPDASSQHSEGPNNVSG